MLRGMGLMAPIAIALFEGRMEDGPFRTLFRAFMAIPAELVLVLKG